MKSIFKKSILLNNLLKFWWVPTLSAILMFLAVPFPVLERNVESLIQYQRTISITSILSQALLIVAFLAKIISPLFNKNTPTFFPLQHFFISGANRYEDSYVNSYSSTLSFSVREMYLQKLHSESSSITVLMQSVNTAEKSSFKKSNQLP